MIEELPIHPVQIVLAEAKWHEMGQIPNSITDGQGTVHGFLGEFLVAERIEARIENTYDYDMVKNGYRIDAKTKRCTSKPHDDYECSIAAQNIRQKCDYYIFVRIMRDFSQAWLLGAIRKSDYFCEARFCKKGDPDPARADFTFKADCYNLPISRLRPVHPQPYPF